MPIDDRTNYEKASDALDQAMDGILDPPGQADSPEGERVPWATAAVGAGIGYALLALADELKARD